MASAAAAEEEHGPVYVGAGVWLRERDGRVVVGGVAAGGGASQSGLVGEGDEVRMVDHVPVDGLAAAAVEEMLVGEEGSVVILTLAKPGDGGALTHATLVRRSSLREREEAARRRKEIYDVGLGLAVPRRRGRRVWVSVPVPVPADWPVYPGFSGRTGRCILVPDCGPASGSVASASRYTGRPADTDTPRVGGCRLAGARVARLTCSRPPRRPAPRIFLFSHAPAASRRLRPSAAPAPGPGPR